MVTAVALLTGCVLDLAPTEPTAEAPTLTPPSREKPDTGNRSGPNGSQTQHVLVEVIDGDTLRTREGAIRVIGIDTPEHGECGYIEAIDAIEKVISPGDEITLTLPSTQNATDAYNRLLRYVSTDIIDDLGFMLIADGHAVARYDSTDGYPWHPMQDDYHKAQIARLVDGSVVTPMCAAHTEKLTPGATSLQLVHARNE